MNPKEVVYISNIPKQATLVDLHGFLKSSGNIVGAAFMRENRNDCRTKIAFVLFENTEQATEACSLDQTLFQAHRLSVLLSNDDRKFLAGFTIMIENTSSDTSEEDLFEACCRYGNVEAVQIPTNYYAFVGFAERSAAHAAQRKLDNSMLKKQKVQVKVLNEDVRVRLEDLDSFKTPRVYNELLRAKQQYYNSTQQQPPQQQQEPESNNSNDNNGQQTMNDDDDDFSPDQYFANDEAFDNMNQQCMDGVNDEFVPASNEGTFPEEECNRLQVFRRNVRFGKQKFVPTNPTSVKVENVPRNVYDEDVIIYFQQFGPIVSLERGLCLSSICTKMYTITYQDEASQERALNCFRREVTLSGFSCTIITMKPGEALQPVKSKCVLISYLAQQATQADVMMAFQSVGDVLYVEKRVRNNGPTIVHFNHSINMNEACSINNIAGQVVFVAPCSQKEYQNFAANVKAFKKAVKRVFKRSPKSEYLMEIEAKEEQERLENITFKTVHNPHYRNPNPRKYSFEVVLYNCPIGTTLYQVKNYFKRAAAVLAIRHEPSAFDPDSWKVYVSFGNYLDAFRAVRLKGKLDGVLVYKHIASESPKLDCYEAVLVKVHSEESISLSRLNRLFISVGGLYFAEKVSISEFVLIFRDGKYARKACLSNKFEKFRIEVCCMKDFIKNKEGATNGTEQRPCVLLSDMYGSNLRRDASVAAKPIKNEPKEENQTIARQQEPRAPVAQPSSRIKQEKPNHTDIPKAPQASLEDVATSSKAKSMPPQASESADLREVLAERRTIQTDCREKLNDLEEMERVIKEKEMDIQRRLEKLERDEANVNALLPSKRSRSQLTEESSKESGSSMRRSGGSQRDGISPRRNESPGENQRIVTYTSGGGGNASAAQRLIVTQHNRSVSPSDRLAHERYIQIREEKIAITQELDSLRQRFDYRKSSRVGALQDLLSGLDREQRDIQIQLEAKRRFRMQDDLGYSGTSFDNSPSPAPRRLHAGSRSRSRSPYRRSASRSRSRHRTRSRSRSLSRSSGRSRPSRRPRPSRSPLSRRVSRSPLSRRVSRSPIAYRSSGGNTRRTISRSRSRSPPGSSRRGASLEKEIYTIGQYYTRHLKHTIYVANISSVVSDSEIEKIFTRYGKVANVDYSRRTRYAEMYFNYLNRSDAFKALDMNNVKIGGRRLRVAFNMDKPCNREKYSLYFRVRKPVSEAIIYRSYEMYGEIDFIWNPEGVTFGTITFRRAENAKVALEVKELVDGTQITARPFIDKLQRSE